MARIMTKSELSQELQILRVKLKMTSEEISNKFGWKKSTVESCMIGRARKETMEALYEALSDSLPVNKLKSVKGILKDDI
jgi:DNA-directed RNA polymerase specialized sigma24 family protein